VEGLACASVSLRLLITFRAHLSTSAGEIPGVNSSPAQNHDADPVVLRSFNMASSINSQKRSNDSTLCSTVVTADNQSLSEINWVDVVAYS